MRTKYPPIPGVISGDKLLAEWFWDEVYNNGFNLSEYNAIRDWEADHPGEDLPDDFTVDEPEILLGDWNLSGKLYVPRQDGKYDFAAVLGWLGGSPTIHVRWSKYTTVVNSMCSPCCPNQADINSGVSDDEIGYLCYTLPPNWFRKEGE